ncbi:MAG: 2TM domain-containing protein [Nostoc sp. DedQUE12b]|uniref:2TM domain-containing protein n=1 Tax=unclassified Nostoc TaxID=2593658 RepID=UPI002AD48C46|nr:MULTISPECIES: 2TM domain-containing protein [unclassified Nostoc]MDZ7951931.1 2TM domain-containing protein [Nostoc sp. DedQUE09]MDZ8087421.1 2TM domain-containing protein [Nostoc sp. DedQUE12b]
MTYDSEDVEQILQKALTRKDKGEFSREQLLEMASELNISSNILETTEQKWLAQQEEERSRHTFNAFRRRAFWSNFVSFLAVNLFLIILNLITSPSYFWAIFPVLGWGLGLFFHWWSVYQSKSEDYEIAFQKWRTQI